MLGEGCKRGNCNFLNSLSLGLSCTANNVQDETWFKTYGDRQSVTGFLNEGTVPAPQRCT